MPITHTDGAQYFSQAEIDDIIRTRLRAQGAELAQAKSALGTAQKAAQKADAHQARIGELEAQLSQAQGGLSRFKAATSLGIHDPDTIWALEQAHQRAMSGVEEGKRAEFGDYLGSLKTDPSLAPSYLRHLFQGQPQQQPGGQAQQPQQPSRQQPGQPATPPPQQPAQQTPAQPQRPAWASSTAGQLPVAPGNQPTFAQRAMQAKSLDELIALQQERRQG